MVQHHGLPHKISPSPKREGFKMANYPVAMKVETTFSHYP